MDTGGMIFWAVIIIGALIYFIMKAPKAIISLEGSKDKKFEDEFIKIKFIFNTEIEFANLNTLKSIGFEIENISSSPIFIDWDNSIFIDPDGKPKKVMHLENIEFNKKSIQKPTLIEPDSNLIEGVVPVDNIDWPKGEDNPKPLPLLKAWKSKRSFLFRFLLVLKIEKNNKPYEFDFAVSKV